jgi:hypothetical protein
MLKKKDLAFLKILSTMKASPAVLQELKKVRAAQRRKKALPVARSASSQSESASTALSTPHLPKQTAGKHEATELSSGSSMETATRRPAPGPQSGAGSVSFPATAAESYQEGPAAVSARNPDSANVKATYAAVVSDSPSLLLPSGTL